MTVDELEVKSCGDLKVVESTSPIVDQNGNDNVQQMAGMMLWRSKPDPCCQAIFGMVQLQGLAGLLVPGLTRVCSVQKME